MKRKALTRTRSKATKHAPKARAIREPELTANALAVLHARYLLKNDLGEIVESPGELFMRVAQAVAEPEGRARDKWAKAFFDMMVSRRFIPNSPTLMNAGREGGQLSACFVLPLPDDLGAIFDALKAAALIHQSGGGTGFSFSRLREKGTTVRSSQGEASGPVSFMRIFDTATETIKQGGVRRGANMAVLRVDHPNILEFVESKLDGKSITNFNISVGATDEFMRAAASGSDFSLRNPVDGTEVRRVNARTLLDRIARCAWECGDPGLVFLDRINLFNPTPQVGEMESTNPCGEQPLLPFESCNLGSLNLGLYVLKEGEFDWKAFIKDIHVAVRFLDNVIEVNTYPVKESAKITLRNRKIGLGIMGLADLLLALGLPYGSQEARDLGERIMATLDREAKRASTTLAREKGAFVNFRSSLWDRLGYPRMRNATVSTVAPTGTISIIAGCSSGIEPIFAGVYHRNVLDGQRLSEVHPMIEKILREQGHEIEGLTDERISEWLGSAWSPAQTLSVEEHIGMQAVFQRHSDSAVSKTINLAESTKPETISIAYRLAYAQGCKGITVYRDKSRATQVLESATSPAVCLDC